MPFPANRPLLIGFPAKRPLLPLDRQHLSKRLGVCCSPPVTLSSHRISAPMPPGTSVFLVSVFVFLSPPELMLGSPAKRAYALVTAVNNSPATSTPLHGFTYNIHHSTATASRRQREGCTSSGGSPPTWCPQRSTRKSSHSSPRFTRLAVSPYFHPVGHVLNMTCRSYAACRRPIGLGLGYR